jgi:glycerol-3-phosphate dehydrogenase
VIFTIPFAGDFTLIGTTERDYSGDLANPQIDAAEIDYLLDMTNRYFARDLTRDAVVWTFAGLRPLLAASTVDPKGITRDYVLQLDRHGPPLLSVYGGKITTYRRLAEDVVDKLAPLLGCGNGHWTANATLPGGDLSGVDPSSGDPTGRARSGVHFDAFLASLATRYPWLPAELRHRYARAYGTRLTRLIGDARELNGLGEEVLPGLYAAEIDYLRREEWAVTAEDILWRRSKLGLRPPSDAGAALDAWLAAHPIVSV